MQNSWLAVAMLWGVVLHADDTTVTIQVDSKSEAQLFQLPVKVFPCDKIKGTEFFIEPEGDFYVPKIINPNIVCASEHAGE